MQTGLDYQGARPIFSLKDGILKGLTNATLLLDNRSFCLGRDPAANNIQLRQWRGEV